MNETAGLELPPPNTFLVSHGSYLTFEDNNEIYLFVIKGHFSLHISCLSNAHIVQTLLYGSEIWWDSWNSISVSTPDAYTEKPKMQISFIQLGPRRLEIVCKIAHWRGKARPSTMKRGFYSVRLEALHTEWRIAQHRSKFEYYCNCIDMEYWEIHYGLLVNAQAHTWTPMPKRWHVPLHWYTQTLQHWN